MTRPYQIAGGGNGAVQTRSLLLHVQVGKVGACTPRHLLFELGRFGTKRESALELNRRAVNLRRLERARKEASRGLESARADPVILLILASISGPSRCVQTPSPSFPSGPGGTGRPRDLLDSCSHKWATLNQHDRMPPIIKKITGSARTDLSVLASTGGPSGT